MHKNLLSAVQNNAFWCDAILRLHKAPGIFEDDFWMQTKKILPLYPNVITLQPISNDNESRDKLYSILKNNLKEGFSVKDSFGELDLFDLAFKK